jgi:hypothetical protein
MTRISKPAPLINAQFYRFMPTRAQNISWDNLFLISAFVPGCATPIATHLLQAHRGTQVFVGQCGCPGGSKS